MAQVAQSREKVWTGTKILSPNIRYFVAKLKFVAIYTHFGNIWAKKELFWTKTVLFGQKSALVCCMYCVYTVNVQICKYLQNQRICRQNSKHALDESFYGHFCSRRNAANFSHPEERLRSTAGGRVECRFSGEEDSAKVEKKHCGRNHGATKVVYLLVLSVNPPTNE